MRVSQLYLYEYGILTLHYFGVWRPAGWLSSIDWVALFDFAVAMGSLDWWRRDSSESIVDIADEY